ncbi:protein SODIUM POTASSIUM ROOT DEFECTIVE 3-like [Zingiber officinale]|uniref:protein SODIUM POTASSIUM ROOT DEFECTIVE 3-like n=1 Tax=Zingiber officinale TaxID=94328 RepID=UPI001C4BA9CB|nr:protein SODIUM POTASSIUM ROOT DEFECTIVE 3-like [Zingiber officinale]
METCPNNTNIPSRKGWERMLSCFSLVATRRSCVYLSDLEEGEAEAVSERKAMMKSHVEQVLRIKGVVDEEKTLAFHLEPKSVVLRVSMHCTGCAKKMEKHISKMSLKVDLEKQVVVVFGDNITPFEVLSGISKVKFAELWLDTS